MQSFEGAHREKLRFQMSQRVKWAVHKPVTHFMKVFVSKKCKTKLRTASEYSSRPALEERLQALLAAW